MSHLPRPRKKTKAVPIGSLLLGGGNPVAVQSMTKTPTDDVRATVNQIKKLQEAGCELVRVAVPDEKAAASLRDIKENIDIPLVADIHYDHRLALAAIKQGVDKLRLNPGNIGSREKVLEVVKAAKETPTAIRVGVNSGSLETALVDRFGVTPRAMVRSALSHVRLLEGAGFEQIVISLKSSSVADTIEAYQMISKKCDYPLHLGITEAGMWRQGTVKSALGIGYLLLHGIGDTIRVSLTGDPVREVKVAFDILRAAGVRRRGVELISCPTCGRCQVDLSSVAAEVDAALSDITESLTVAVMGCIVNGPGEAKEADVGVAAGRGRGAIFREGEIVNRVDEDEIVSALLEEVESFLSEHKLD